MNEDAVALHYVCTRDRARDIIDAHTRFWVSNCGCRELRGTCERSRIDVCLQFRETTAASPSGLREITKAEAEKILDEARDKHLVSRPFRNEVESAETDGICFCCDDCCGYFIDPGGYTCDKGAMIEDTDMDTCTHCGECVGVCHFGARKVRTGSLVVDRSKCYGCGLCVDVCPEACIKMAPR
jgi:ferredoxin